MNLNDWTKKDLLALPMRDWNEWSTYDSILVLKAGKKHDSGWACMAIIGVNGITPVEIASMGSDDISWVMPKELPHRTLIGDIRCDCAFKSGALHFWQAKHRFRVGLALSSIEITVVKES